MQCVQNIFTGRNEVVAKVIFLHLFVILFTGGGVLPQCMLGYQPPQIRQTPPDQTPPPPRTRQTPPDQTPPHPGPGRHPPRPGRHPPRTRQTPSQHTVYERPVRILLECILVYYRNPSFPVPCPVQCEHAIGFT